MSEAALEEWVASEDLPSLDYALLLPVAYKEGPAVGALAAPLPSPPSEFASRCSLESSQFESAVDCQEDPSEVLSAPARFVSILDASAESESASSSVPSSSRRSENIGTAFAQAAQDVAEPETKVGIR